MGTKFPALFRMQHVSGTRRHETEIRPDQDSVGMGTKFQTLFRMPL